MDNYRVQFDATDTIMQTVNRVAKWVAEHEEAEVEKKLASLGYFKRDKYAWHDLRKNPSDLPQHEEDVLVLEKDFDEEFGWEQYIVTKYRRIWNPFTNERMELKRWELPQYHKQEYAIAWREIEPFEECE